jgi:hypothetical protein
MWYPHSQSQSQSHPIRPFACHIGYLILMIDREYVVMDKLGSYIWFTFHTYRLNKSTS